MTPYSVRKGQIGILDAIGQSIAMNGPAATVSLYLVALSEVAGYSMTLVLFISFLMYAAITSIVYQWTKITYSPAPWAKYASMGLGRWLGFVSGWLYWLYYIIGFAGFGLLGMAAFLNSVPEFSTDGWMLYPLAAILCLEAVAISLRRIKFSTRYFVVTGIAEIVFLTATGFSLLYIFRGNIHYATTMNLRSVSPIAVILGIGSFGGVSGLAPLSFETRNPTRSVPLSLAVSLVLIGFTVVFSSFAQSTVFGPSKFLFYSSISDPGYWIYGKYLGPVFSIILLIFILNSFNSSLVATSNNYSRMFFGIFMKGEFSTETHPAANPDRMPRASIFLGAAGGLSIALISGTVFGPFWGSIFPLVIAAILSYSSHIIVSVSLAAFGLRTGRPKFLVHLFIPVIATVILAFAIATTAISDDLYPLNISVMLSFLVILAGFMMYPLLFRNDGKR